MKIVIVYGTRPELIKLAPVYMRAKADDHCKATLVATGQHGDLAESASKIFSIKPDIKMQVMTAQQSLNDLLGRTIVGVGKVVEDIWPDVVLVQGDTTTALAGAIASNHLQIPVAHVEAGLRSGDPQNPFPEEQNRMMVSKIANFHFAPTQGARRNLLNEGVADNNIHVVGNTIVDAIKTIIGQPIRDIPLAKSSKNRKKILVTLHRRENVGAPLERICDALIKLASVDKKREFILPVHPNPSIKETILLKLSNHDRINLISPLDYASLLNMMSELDLIITDSGGIQEEAPSFNVPLLICRNTTERPEILDSQLGVLVGSDTRKIIDTAERWLLAPPQMKNPTNPFGDGRSSQRIVQILKRFINATA